MSGEVFFSLAGVLYAVLVAFVVVVVWEQFVDAEAAAQSEASAIADLLRDSQAFPASERPQLQQSLTAYAQDVVDDEFPRMRQGESIEQQSEHLTTGLGVIHQGPAGDPDRDCLLRLRLSAGWTI